MVIIILDLKTLVMTIKTGKKKKSIVEVVSQKKPKKLIKAIHVQVGKSEERPKCPKCGSDVYSCGKQWQCKKHGHKFSKEEKKDNEEDEDMEETEEEDTDEQGEEEQEDDETEEDEGVF